MGENFLIWEQGLDKALVCCTKKRTLQYAEATLARAFMSRHGLCQSTGELVTCARAIVLVNVTVMVTPGRKGLQVNMFRDPGPDDIRLHAHVRIYD